MKSEYIPVLVDVDGKEEIWRMDITNLSITDLIKLKEELLNSTYTKTIRALDSIIKSDVESIIPTHNISNGSYMREYKKTKKEEKQKIRTKSWRRKYDKHKR